MTLLILVLAVYGLFILAYQVTGVVIGAVALVGKASRAADTLINMPPPPDLKVAAK